MVDEVQSAIKNALVKLNSERTRIDRRVSALRAALAALSGPGQGNGTAPAPRRKMSAEARRALGKRMKAYWAKKRAAKGKTEASK